MVYKGKRWYQFPKQQLEAAGLRTWLSVRHKQLALYQNFESLERLIVDTVPIKGPLRGILSAHKRYPQQDWMVLPCDMLFLQEATLQLLRRAGQQTSTPKVVLFGSSAQPEPLVGYYPASVLAATLQRYQGGVETDYSLKGLLRQSGAHYLPITTAMQPQFRNWNEPGTGRF